LKRAALIRFIWGGQDFPAQNFRRVLINVCLRQLI
jgi:hypothetical protein